MTLRRTTIVLAALALLAAGATGLIASLAHSEEINGEFTATETPGPKHVAAIYDGVQITEALFSDEKWKVKCEKVKMSANSQGGQDKNLTFTVAYTECDAFYEHESEETKFPATVDMKSCDYEFEQPIEQKKDEYSGPMNILCPKESIVITVYEIGNTQLHSGEICTFNLFEAKALTKITFVDQTNAIPPTDFTLDADVNKIPYEEKGTTCPDETGKKFTSGKLQGRTTISATTADGKKTIDAVID